MCVSVYLPSFPIAHIARWWRRLGGGRLWDWGGDDAFGMINWIRVWTATGVVFSVLDIHLEVTELFYFIRLRPKTHADEHLTLCYIH